MSPLKDVYLVYLGVGVVSSWVNRPYFHGQLKRFPLLLAILTFQIALVGFICLNQLGDVLFSGNWGLVVSVSERS